LSAHNTTRLKTGKRKETRDDSCSQLTADGQIKTALSFYAGNNPLSEAADFFNIPENKTFKEVEVTLFTEKKQL